MGDRRAGWRHRSAFSAGALVSALRPPQMEAIAATRKAWSNGVNGALVVLPTGVGKTRTALELVSSAAAKGLRVLWLAHREELLEQPLAAFRAQFPDLARVAGVVQAERDECDRLVVFASIDTLRSEKRRALYLGHGAPQFVVVDEAHHSAASTWAATLSAIDEAATAARGRPPYRLGLTATPDRADGKSLTKLWTLVYSFSILRAINEGYLVPVVSALEVLPELDLSGVSGGADFNEEELGQALEAAGVVGHTVAALKKHGSGRQAFVFCATVAQAKRTADALREAGVVARYVHGETPKDERRTMLSAFRAGRIEVLCNVAVLTEGTDLPTASCVVVARPTRSRALYMQMIGRGLRTYPNKVDCVVVDLVGATEEHRMIVAPILLEQVAKEEREASDLLENGKESRDATWKKGRKVVASWVRVPKLDRDVWAVACGDHGVACLIQQDDELWRPVLLPKSKAAVELADTYVDFDTAQALGEDVARQAASLTRLAAPWRQQTASDNAVGLLAKFYDAHTPAQVADFVGAQFDGHPTKGAVNDRLVAEQTMRDIHRRRLATRTDKEPK